MGAKAAVIVAGNLNLDPSTKHKVIYDEIDRKCTTTERYKHELLH